MISDAEKARMRVVEEGIHHLTDMMMNELGADSDDSEMRAKAAGAQLATLDALFAIREGTEWRGLIDPKEIARKLLRESGMGDA